MTSFKRDETTFVPKAGDQVQLKSGGPVMTVEARYDPAIHKDVPGADVLVIYFVGTVLEARWFPDVVLKPSEEHS